MKKMILKLVQQNFKTYLSVASGIIFAVSYLVTYVKEEVIN